MASAKTFKIKENLSEIKKLIKGSNAMLGKRLQALLIFKQNEDIGMSKRQVADAIGVNHNSVQTWRTAYITGGITSLMAHSNIGYKPSQITIKQEKSLQKKLYNPNNGMAGFVELLDWFNQLHKTEIKYKTFHGFVVRKFNAKVKVARKVHIKKDKKVVATFKKTSVNTARI